MGHTMRTERYRLTEWAPDGKDFREYELYDYQTDPQGNLNLAGDLKHAGKLKELTEIMHAGWRQAALDAR